VQALANSKELVGKAAMHAIMMMKQEAINVAFGGVTSVPPPHSVSGALSTRPITSTPSGIPPALEPNTPVAHALALGAHGRGGTSLSRFGNLNPMSGSAGSCIDLNRTPSTGCTTSTVSKKPRRISTVNMPRVVNLFDDMPEHARAPTDEVMAHPTCQLSLPVG
jgi:hypothetical protein